MSPEAIPLKEILANAAEAETSGKLEAAAELYEKAIKADKLAEYAYDRLVIIYRKLQEYKKELRVLNTGIKAFEQFYKSQKPKSKKVADLSEKLNKSFGFTDKKGNTLYDPQPIDKWKKRKTVVEKKL